LEESGLLIGEQSVEVFEVHGGFLRVDTPLDIPHPYPEEMLEGFDFFHSAA
jgi:hypothetical protein